MVEFEYKLIFSSGLIGLISIFTPVIFHISPNAIYQFWFWGFTMNFRLNSNEVGISYNTEADFLIPVIIFFIPIILSSVLYLVTSLKTNGSQEKFGRFYIIGAILLIISPLFLMITWQLYYIFATEYPTFWGGNYFWPSLAIFLQLLAGILALIACRKIRVKMSK